MKFKFGLLAILLPLLSRGQAIMIGQAIPPVHLENVRNGSAIDLPSGTPLTLIDFWSIHCGSCMAAIPELNTLQRQFSGKLKILLVDDVPSETPERVKAFLASYSKRTGTAVDLPYVLGDTILSPLFPHQVIPHEVWLGTGGRVLAITGREEINQANIAQVLNGGQVHLATKNDFGYNADLPLLEAGNGSSDGSFLYRSILTGYKEGPPTGSGKNWTDSGRITKAYFINYPLMDLFRAAYPSVLRHHANRIFIEVPDPGRFREATGAAYTRNRFCYELITRPVSPEAITRFEQQDLLRYFGAVASAQVRKLPCWALSVKKENSIRPLRNEKPSVNFEPQTLRPWMHNEPLSILVSYLDGASSLPVICDDTTGIRLDLDFAEGFAGWKMSEKIAWLASRGIDLTPTIRELEVAVISTSAPYDE